MSTPWMTPAAMVLILEMRETQSFGLGLAVFLLTPKSTRPPGHIP